MKGFVRDIIFQAWQMCKPADRKPMHYTRIQAMQNLLSGLIITGARFEEDDFAFFVKECGFRSWASKGSGGRHGRWFQVDEWFYREAVINHNYSAKVSYERFKNRPALRARGNVGEIYVGKELVWKGEAARCSSFNEQKKFITVVSLAEENRRVKTIRIRWDELYQKWS